MKIRGTQAENKELKALVSEHIAKVGTTRTFIAKQVGISRQYVGRWLNEEDLLLSREHLDNIRELLGLPRLHDWAEY